MYLTLVEAATLAEQYFNLAGRARFPRIYQLNWGDVAAGAAKARAVRTIEGDHDFVLLGLSGDNPNSGNLVDIRIMERPLFNRDAWIGLVLPESSDGLRVGVLGFPVLVPAGSTVEGFFSNVGGAVDTRVTILLHAIAVYT